MADASLPLIRLEGIGKTFKGDADEETRALRDVTLDIGRGEYVSVSGPSGCGKSTLLAILALLESPTTGRYWLNGRAVDQLPHAERARLRNVEIGLIFQSFNLIGDMTVQENVEYPLTLRGASDKERVDRVQSALHRVGLSCARQPAPRPALWRPPAARRGRARDCRAAAHSPRGRTDRQPGLEERRSADADAVGAPCRRRDRLPRHPQSRATSPWPAGTSTCSTAA